MLVGCLGWEDSPGGGHSNPLQSSCLKNPMGREAWWATTHRVTQSWTQLKWLSMQAWRAESATSPRSSSSFSWRIRSRNQNLIARCAHCYWNEFLSSVEFSHSVVSLWPHELQHARPPCPSPAPGVHPNPCPSSRWCHSTISSSVIPFSSCPQYFPAAGSFPVSQLFASGGQSIGVSASTSVLPMNTLDWSPLGWTGWISLQSKDSQESSPTPQFKSINSLMLSFLYSPIIHTWPLEKP